MSLYRKNILSAIIALSLVGCGGSSSSSDSSVIDDSQQQTITSLLSIMIPAAIADEAPSGSVVTIKISGNGVDLEKSISSDESTASFDGLILGDYTVSVVVMSGGIELASNTKTTTIGESSNELNIELTLNVASLVVVPLLLPDYTFLNGEYDGKLNKSGCLDLPFNPASTDLSLSITGLAVDIDFSFFPSPVIKMTGDLSDTTGELKGSGTYQSSDFTNGTWTIDKVLQPSETTIFISGQLIDVTNDNCIINFEYIGTDMGGIDMGL
jgi:hypothetical protein